MDQKMTNHLQKSERIQIETLLKIGMSISKISSHLGRDRRTIYREIDRSNADSDIYEAEIYHKAARSNMCREISRSPSLEVICLIEEKLLNEQWSPEQISNWLKLNGYESVSHTWIYKHIKRNKAEGGELFYHLRRRSYVKGHKPYKGSIIDRVSIEERPSIVNARKRLGDYELDLIIGSKNKGAILSIIDRKSRFCILEKLDSKSSEEVSTKTIKALHSSAKQNFTITTDNGTEFADHKTIAKKLGIDYYFAHPYASFERGSIEHLNGLVRQYIPKGTEFSTIDSKCIKNIQHKLNNR
ncbi:MAG: IS30 family transposase, partial [Bacteroidota bacterium]